MFDAACSRLVSLSLRSLRCNETLEAAQLYRRQVHLSASSSSSTVPRNPASTAVRFNLVQPHLHYDPDARSKIRRVPRGVIAPPYATAGHVGPARKQTNLHSLPRIDGVRNACKLARKTLNYLGSQLKVGLTTDELDEMAFDYIVRHDAYPSPLNYMNYPKSICTSVNNVACHGMPDRRPLMDGDILNVDVSVS
ncbi:hypothetical protein RvY_03326-2 [Ramazzottius varieornatus]|uniref:Peptidase M24 domain-containing protein n=1 Tax=Ramazzottius varieornatus TaxID=947166 RepID=A0A1D1UUQ0_RAMVA|nr:hypothetical protein RvY_03326-2 [Ramazzottius varieornatus]